MNNDNELELKKYIFDEVYMNKNKEISNKFLKLVSKLKKNLNNPNELLVSTWVNNYIAFLDNYKDSLDKDKLISYMRLLFNEYDKDKKYVDKLDDYIGIKDNSKEELKEEKVETDEKLVKDEKIDEIKEEVKPLNIINIKKPIINKKYKNVLKGLALVGVGLKTGLVGVLSVYCVYKLIKKGIKSEMFNLFIEKHGYKIVNNELYDEENNKVTEEIINNIKVKLFKNKLFNLNKEKDNGMIKNSFKKNKITSMLLNMKLVQSIKNKFNNVDGINFSNSIDEEKQVMYKGMGKC